MQNQKKKIIKQKRVNKDVLINVLSFLPPEKLNHNI